MSTEQTLSVDLELMRAVAAGTDRVNDELRVALHAFITRMAGVPAAVWSGSAATRFQSVLDRWNREAMQLHRALHEIAQTIRANERALRAAADDHAHRVAAAGGQL